MSQKLSLILDEPRLDLQNFEREVNCIWNSTEISPSLSKRQISTVKCFNEDHCSFMKGCFQNKLSCTNVHTKRSINTTECFADGASMPCASLPYSHLNGIVECKDNSLTRYFTYFNSLGFIKCN